ncbi:cell wall alpha-1,3-glucan synthase Mok13 [Schizosaccharomyces pombe]|uniref:Cell wall alpha-1,3-glucan synthase mok13 n=1 Tax=Schizosaccharomyces pombe (strain 972 / ATCC 24843) TaxID=284812 RepID=MOK13_SCHPO|nr:alpha-1,3-glucan synthase Mok13 [Schizosaccharomyces pombe]Q9Y719.2 RecName: Full=Cell wall alpha-1,3-glucan synthase mok13 [Schizosaccharomyces pombe 972h-]CAB38509.1 alpha-1,3-glucan synthase Mok13 [Schizosaccharomyces pombe]|eukprot:NP_596500.1 alpha-1,3-glucan synthase Mok13 [Schizosaccharomyces pombe]
MRNKNILVLNLILSIPRLVFTAKYDERESLWNLNQNQSATDPLDYWGKWENHQYHPSPDDWQVPFYTVILDKWKDGDPRNNEANNTIYEYDIYETGFRNGGDIIGLKDSLDYLEIMGIKVIYIAGTPFLNQPWGADQYSPLDYTILDHHSGTIAQWRDTIEEIHRRGFYLVLDLTISTLGDLIGFRKYLNSTTPFSLFEHEAVWKSNVIYPDWNFTNKYDPKCELPRFWGEDGAPVVIDYVGCYDSDFDQYGDTEAFGTHPDWERQLSKFASVQDRLREWRPSVSEKLKHFACMIIAMLDVDGFRIDKATQITVDFLASWAHSVRGCAATFNKKNFFIPGEVTGSSSYGSIYYGRGRQPDQRPPSILTSLNSSSLKENYFLREPKANALDASAFHYSLYRAMTRFLQMDGDLQVGHDLPVDFTDLWNAMAVNEDFYNPNTHKVDPRHMLGITNHDVFRWSAIEFGLERLLLGTMITYFLFPGAPSIYYGDEQGFYVLDNTANNYLYGRQAMPSSIAWKVHGCYALASDQYPELPVIKAYQGCNDDWNIMDHFDFAKPELKMFKIFNFIREQYPALKSGWKSVKLRNWTEYVHFPNSGKTPTEVGVWSIVRGALETLQNFDARNNTAWNGDIWILYTNQNRTTTLDYQCSSSNSVVSPYASGLTLKNLIYPFEEYILQESNKYSSNLKSYYGCIPNIEFPPWGFKILIPKKYYVRYPPQITSFNPQHDSRIYNHNGKQKLVISFTETMDCNEITSKLQFSSKTESGKVMKVDKETVKCSVSNNSADSYYFGLAPARFHWSGDLINIADGIHEIKLQRVHSQDHQSMSDSMYKLLLRFGKLDNPMVFSTANRSSSILSQENEKLYINHKAPGADLFRFSFDYGLHWSEWIDYLSNKTECTEFANNISLKTWKGHHVIVQYWSRLTASANYIQEGGLGSLSSFPHLYMNGPYNQWGFDSGIPNRLIYKNCSWHKTFISDVFPTKFQFNVYNFDESGMPDQKKVYGTIGNSTVLVRLPPSELKESVTWIKEAPPSNFLTWEIIISDLTRTYHLIPRGSSTVSIILFSLFLVSPLICALATMLAFQKFFYQVRLNKGIEKKQEWKEKLLGPFSRISQSNINQGFSHQVALNNSVKSVHPKISRKLILVATLEYDIPDWDIKIKIGGLGVMAELMGKHLTHHDLIWVVPRVGDVNYPDGQELAPLEVVVLDQVYEVRVYSHNLRNITYILLEAPVFRKQTSAEPYPARMDDLSSAIFYSAWNQCIAGIIRRYPIDVYHINDYHGALAPCYLLPNVIPCVLSLHNAEFQGLWPLRTQAEKNEVCAVYNISTKICTKYIQFGNVFNLLHAGVSYIRIHQKGYGVVGVSNKYGKRSKARYPIFWGLKKVGKLPNPDPLDTAQLDDPTNITEEITIDLTAEAEKRAFKRDAQKWTNLELDDSADLLVFVGRWSMQKGIDLIADIAPTLLQDFNAQLITIGPIIDLYGKFAAEKLNALMKKYPKRVYCRPEFTHLPPCIFSGADFVLIPSRDEPFGLVAVEFGRKGALGIGARVGGLGQMPGWWYSVESNATSHVLQQFEEACRKALSSSAEKRALLRAKSAKQRFPVLEWISKLDHLMDNCIRLNVGQRQQGSSSHSMKFRSKNDLSSIKLSTKEGLENEENELKDKAPPNEPNVGSLFLFNKSSMGSVGGPGHYKATDLSQELETNDQDIEYNEFYSQLDTSTSDIFQDTSVDGFPDLQVSSDINVRNDRLSSFVMSSEDLRSSDGHPENSDSVLETISSVHHRSPINQVVRNLNESQLSLDSVISMNLNKEFALTKTENDFTDDNGRALNYFSQKLEELDPKNSVNELCIETFILKMKKEWYDGLRNIRFGIQRPNLLIYDEDKKFINTEHFLGSKVNLNSVTSLGNFNGSSPNSFLFLLKNRTMRIKCFMQMRIGDWPVYSIFLSVGQILAATSYQLVLLSGSSAQFSTQLYIVGSIYTVSSVFWWYLYRMLPSVASLSLPFLLYCASFLLIGISSFINENMYLRLWISHIASWIYAVASASGSLYFSLNFGDEAGAGVVSWIVRACIVQGFQQIWACCLWYWGSYIDRSMQECHSFPHEVYPLGLIAVFSWPLALVMLLFAILLIFGLPDYYWESPGNIPAFYTALLRRKLVLWFFVATILQNYWLSTLYGRSWKYLWGGSLLAPWKMLTIAFFLFLSMWIIMLMFLGRKSLTHSWLLPVFGVGLGSPRWLQMMWGTSNIGVYLPWAGVAGPIVGRILWIWLGVLDSVQGVGVGMILLQTLTRRHIATTLIAGQIIGTLTSMLARATAPNRLGPGLVFLDLTSWRFEDGAKIFRSAPFWICLISQIAVSAGYLLFFRRENLSRP